MWCWGGFVFREDTRGSWIALLVMDRCNLRWLAVLFGLSLLRCPRMPSRQTKVQYVHL